MPELPDVQVFKEYLDATGLHQRIRRVDVATERMLRGVTSGTVKARLTGHELASTRRHGKHLFVRVTGDGWLWLHFGMTGELAYFTDAPAPAHTRLRLDFTNGSHLAYVNVRTLGRIGLVDDVDEFVEREDLGPDALTLDLRGFREALAGHRGPIKRTLMDQRVLAGIGNAYADEVLFAAGVDPRARVEGLGRDTIHDLHRAMKRVLRAAIDARVTLERFPRSFLLPHRHAGATCPRCGGRLHRLKISGRTTYYCPRDQPAGR